MWSRLPNRRFLSRERVLHTRVSRRADGVRWVHEHAGGHQQLRLVWARVQLRDAVLVWQLHQRWLRAAAVFESVAYLGMSRGELGSERLWERGTMWTD